MRLADAAVALAAVLVGGCAQILGLDSTDRRDADTPGACSIDLHCASGADRAVCGRLVDAVTQQPFQVPGATGTPCQPGAQDGPCAFSITGENTTELFTATGTPIAATVVDDCGRFRVEGLTGDKLAVSAQPVAPVDQTYRRVVRTILLTPTGPFDGLEIPVVSNALVAGWENRAAVTVSEGFLLLFRRGGAPKEGTQAKIDTSLVLPPPGLPYALYFAGANRFETVIETDGDGPHLKTEAGPSGTALLVPADGNPFTLSGLFPGKNCDDIPGVNLVTGALVFMEVTNC